MDCFKCKKSLPADSRFCAYCGAKFKPQKNDSSGDFFKGAATGAGAALGGVMLGGLMTHSSVSAHAESLSNTTKSELPTNTLTEGASVADFMSLDEGLETHDIDVLAAFGNLTGGSAEELSTALLDSAAGDSEGVIDILSDVFEI